MASPAPPPSAPSLTPNPSPDTSTASKETQPKGESSPSKSSPPPMSARQKNIEARLAADSWDVDAWMQLLQEASSRPWPQADLIYQRLVDQFPPIPRFWLARAEHSSKSNPQETVSIYEQGVKNASTSIELWRAYLNHLIASVTHAEAEGQPANFNGLVPTFERAVQAAGLDLQATPLWNDYVAFLKTRAVLSDPQRRDALRLVFQRAVRTPMHQLENVWRDYTTFEQTANTNKEIGRVLLAEYQPKNVDARTEFRARKARREGLALTSMPVPPRGRAKEASQAAQWRRFIAAEQKNSSAALPPDELHARVVHAYESALVPLYRYPNIWIEYMQYLYDALLPPVEVPLDATGSSAPKREVPPQDPAKVENAVKQLEPVFARAVRALPACVALQCHISALWERLGSPKRGVQVLDELCKNHPTPLAYVHLMRVTRRTNGRDAARKAFGRARKDPRGADPNIYVAAAMLEFTVNKDQKIARNVFEFGMKKYADSALMVCAFIEWLWGLGEFEYMRVVFEKSMSVVKGDATTVRKLWELWLKVEAILGDHSTVDRVEAMWQESNVGRPTGVVNNVLRRCRYNGFEGMNADEIAAIEGAVSVRETDNSGKRDPRLARRSTAGGNVASAASGLGSMSMNGRVGGASTIQLAFDKLNRMAAAFGSNLTGAPPTVEFAMSLIRSTPDLFGDTPTGRAVAAANGSGSGTSEFLGKRSRNEPNSSPTMPNQNPPAATPLNDVFRARQAAKQARSR